MICDDLDLWIIEMFYKKKVTSTWNIAKSFKWEDKKNFEKKSQLNDFYTNKTHRVEYRIKKMIQEGFMRIEKNDEKIYVLDTQRVKLQRHKLPDGYKDCILIKDKDDKWIIFQIGQ